MTTIIEQARAARAQGLTRFIGPPCPYGHTLRETFGAGACYTCQRADVRRAKAERRIWPETIEQRKRRLGDDLYALLY